MQKNAFCNQPTKNVSVTRTYFHVAQNSDSYHLKKKLKRKEKGKKLMMLVIGMIK